MSLCGRFEAGYRRGTSPHRVRQNAAWQRDWDGRGGGCLRRGDVWFGKEGGTAAFEKTGANSRHCEAAAFPRRIEFRETPAVRSASEIAKDHSLITSRRLRDQNLSGHFEAERVSVDRPTGL